MSKKPSGPPATSSVAYADGWVEQLRSQLPETVRTWDAGAIHQSRVATRRLAAAVDVVTPVLTKDHRKPLAKALRRIRRQLGPLRDLDVMLEQLAAFGPSPGVDWLRGQLDAARTRRRSKAADDFRPKEALAKLGAWFAVRQEWVEAGTAVDDLMANAVHLQLDAFAEHAAAVTGGQGSAADRDPHALRIAGKELRYTLEMAVASGHRLPAAVTRTFKRMQDALGAWHDAVVLAERALHATLDAGLAYHDPALHLAVADVARSAVRRSQRHLAAFADLWAKQGPAVAETIRERLPVAVSGPQTDPDPPDSAGTPDPAAPAPADPPTA